MIWMTPPNPQVQLAPRVSPGFPPINVVIAPPTHGVVTGMHGMGVSTPSAAAVAAATCGLARLVHMPNGGMFMIGIASVIAAAGLPSISTRAIGRTFSVAGAMPKLHCSIAVAVAAGLPMVVLSSGTACRPPGPTAWNP